MKLATCQAELGRFVLADARGAEGLAIAEAVGHPPSVMFGSWGAGWAAFRRGDTDRAATLLERALGICREVGLVLHLPMVAVPLAGTWLLAGRTDAAVTLLEGTLERVVAHGMANFYGVCRYALAEALAAAGRLDEAADHATDALAAVRRQEERGYEAYTLRVLSELARRRGDAGTALARTPREPRDGGGVRHGAAPGALRSRLCRRSRRAGAAPGGRGGALARHGGISSPGHGRARATRRGGPGVAVLIGAVVLASQKRQPTVSPPQGLWVGAPATFRREGENTTWTGTASTSRS